MEHGKGFWEPPEISCHNKYAALDDENMVGAGVIHADEGMDESSIPDLKIEVKKRTIERESSPKAKKPNVNDNQEKEIDLIIEELMGSPQVQTSQPENKTISCEQVEHTNKFVEQKNSSVDLKSE